MKHKYMVPAVVVALIAMFGVLNACDSLFGSSSSSTPPPAVVLQGRIAEVGGSSGVGALNAEDWVVVALSWGPDFEHPDILSQLEDENITGDTLNMDAWEEAAVIPVGPDGSFSWAPPANKRFVLFAVEQ